MNAVTSRPPSRLGLGLGLLALAHLIISVDFNIVYVALPEIGRELGFTAQSLQWVVSAYAVGFGGFLLLGGRMVDRLGRRRMFVAGLVLFGLSSLVGGAAAGPGSLVAARVGQGLGAALLFPATLSLVNTSFAAGPQRNKAVALWGVAGASGAVVGPMVGGVLTNYLGWSWVFFVNVPLTLGAAMAAVRVLAADSPRELAGQSQGGAGRGFDVPGALIASAGSTLVVFGLVSGPQAGWISVRAVGSLVVGAALLGGFLLVERRTRDPLVPPRMFRIRSLATAMALIFIFMGTVNTLHYLFFIHMQNVLGYGALGAGLAFLPMSVLAIVGSWKLLPTLLNRWGVRGALFTGMLGSGIAMAAVAAGMRPDGSYWALLPGIVALGLFAGMTYPAVFAAAGSAVSPGEQGVASALTSTAQQIGGAVGLAALVAVANAGLSVHAGAAPAVSEVVDGLRTAGWVAAVVTIAGAALVLRLEKARPRAVQEAADVQEADEVTAHSR